MEFIVDDFEGARKFISSLPNYIKKQRFNRYASSGVPEGWSPDHLVLAVRDGQGVALADMVNQGENNEVGTLSIVAKENGGAYAIRCLETLKIHYPRTQWASTLKRLSPALKAISFRHVDVTFDHTAKEIATHLVETHGFKPEFIPSPLFPSQRTLKKYDLPHVNKWDDASKQQFLHVASNLIELEIVSPSGNVIDPPDFQSMCFELLEASETERQGMSRGMLVLHAMRYGHELTTPFMKRAANHPGMSSFFNKISSAIKGVSGDAKGMFEITSKDPELVSEIRAKLGI